MRDHQVIALIVHAVEVALAVAHRRAVVQCRCDRHATVVHTFGLLLLRTMPAPIPQHVVDAVLSLRVAFLRTLLSRRRRGRRFDGLLNHQQTCVRAGLRRQIVALERVFRQLLDLRAAIVEPRTERLRLLIGAEEHALTGDRDQLTARFQHVVRAHDVRRVLAIGERRIHDHCVILLFRFERLKVVRGDVVTLRA
ncbi:hypothetical protein AWB80_08140 [Caballeronia pedi]|uniref:Uncharacterized protein n=1 Tax=Caballeronia pedi TaxID=1777141 RepID=A0A158E4Z2_9BURK|nr:hypothetical protein AWB80_08140 [Caballeronia pedi]